MHLLGMEKGVSPPLRASSVIGVGQRIFDKNRKSLYHGDRISAPAERAEGRVSCG
jgi:hypothetical protein